jgi:hypothetical protein
MTDEQKKACDAVDEIMAAGWTFHPWPNGYRKGWWRLLDSDNPVLAMRRGDPKNFWVVALIVKKLYLEES